MAGNAVTVVHVYDNVEHLDVAHTALEQARDYTHPTGPMSAVIRNTIRQLAAWIEFTEDEDEPA